MAQSPLGRWLGARRAANARHAAAEPRALPPTPPTHSGKMGRKLVKNDVIPAFKALFGRNWFLEIYLNQILNVSAFESQSITKQYFEIWIDFYNWHSKKWFFSSLLFFTKDPYLFVIIFRFF